MSGFASSINGKKGGRPTYNDSLRIYLPDIEFVILTPNQYNTLLEKYGYALLEKAIKILDYWLENSPNSTKYVGKNNYGHFRSDGWVINSAKHTFNKD